LAAAYALGERTQGKVADDRVQPIADGREARFAAVAHERQVCFAGGWGEVATPSGGVCISATDAITPETIAKDRLYAPTR
jgi:hypothetical protein